MIISNGIKCECFFPYGGIDRGVSIKPGDFSRALPASRFLNKLVQKDWIKGVIRVYLTKDEVVQYTAKLKGVTFYPIKEGAAAGLLLLSKGPQATPVAEVPVVVAPVEVAPVVDAPVEAAPVVVKEPVSETVSEVETVVAEETHEKKTRKKKKVTEE